MSSPAVSKLPAYLRKYVAEQRYDAYTSQEHAAWRYIMRQNRAFFSKHAVPVYLEGLKRTGISIDRIPRISEMDQCLASFGWGAVPVTGFIPPAAFLDFQAHGVLPIACDMRTVNHIAYTPAPDIVHEAAGHAPIIADEKYADYLKRYARMAQKAIQSAEDIRLYEAIRYLSDVKENPDIPPATIARAEQMLKHAAAGITHTSENAKVSRMAWWTVEYGMVGPIDKPLFYGAGLLSSVGESQAAAKVRKVPLTVACVEQTYDITEPQPQLFVAPNMDTLVDVLEELEETLAFRRGGVESLEKAKVAATVNTVVLDSGIQVSGQLVDYRVAAGKPAFLKFSGPCQLSRDGKEIAGQGRKRHPDGYSSPVGKARWSDAGLEFESGIKLVGKLKAREKDLATFTDCTVTWGQETLYRPEWGEFDLVLGETVPSVFGGPADWASFGDLSIGEATSTPGRTSPHTADEKKIFAFYAETRALRTQGVDEARLRDLAARVELEFPQEWLLELEIVEIARQKKIKGPWLDAIEARLHGLGSDLVEKGLELAGVPD